jgi:hypothetical protein
MEDSKGSGNGAKKRAENKPDAALQKKFVNSMVAEVSNNAFVHASDHLEIDLRVSL